MKRLLLSIIAVCMSICLIACQNKTDKSESQSNSGKIKISTDTLEISQFNDCDFSISAPEPTEIARVGAFEAPDIESPYYAYDSVYMTLEKREYSFDETVRFSIHNETESELGAGDYYQVEIYLDGNWYVLPRGDIMDIMDIIPVGEYDEGVPIGDVDADLIEGRYRVLFPVDMPWEDNTALSIVLCGEFDLHS